MISFLSNQRPRSVNAQRKQHYYDGLENALVSYHNNIAPSDNSLYGFVYYFHKIKTQLDADNISKPIWDALNGKAFIDDRQIRFRSSGIFDLSQESIDVLDLTNMPDNVFVDFLSMIDDKNIEHIIYVEIGEFDYGLLQIGYSR